MNTSQLAAPTIPIVSPLPGTRIERTSAEVVRPLRRAVLRPHLQPFESEFRGDDIALHVALFLIDKPEKPVACLSLIPTKNGDWQLRGMAVADGYRHKGYGTNILAWGESGLLLSDTPNRRIWCFARAKAVPFYEKRGYRITSPEVEYPDPGFRQFGPYRIMEKVLQGPPRS